MSAPLVLHAFSTFAVGGAQARFATVANALGPQFRHAIVAMDGNLACRERLDAGLDVTFPGIAIRKGDALGTVRTLRAALLQLRPSRLVTSNWGTIEWAMANRAGTVPHIHVEDGFGPEERTRQLPRRVWTRRLFLAGRTVVVPSLTLQRIATGIWRLNPARVRYVPNGIDLDRFTPRQGGGNAVPVIGTVAALRAEKNLGRLLRAFALVQQPARLLVIGDGPERPALADLARSLGVAERVDWAGHVTDPSALIRGTDVFAMSSDTEQMPISLLEAMGAGLPVASTDVGDVAAMLPAVQRPLVVPLDDPASGAALGAALSQLVADPTLRATLGAANRARVEVEYDRDRMVASWAALWRGG